MTTNTLQTLKPVKMKHPNKIACFLNIIKAIHIKIKLINQSNYKDR